MSKVTISDIAAKAGVSAGTVDRVIHRRGEVSAKTREKILKIIEEMNYEPDIVASSLASKKTLRFAALFPSDNNPFWKKPAEGLELAWQEVKHFGIAFEKYQFIYHDKYTFYENLDSIVDSKPDGVVLTPVFTDRLPEYLKKLQQENIPYVFLNTQLDHQQNLAFIGQDSRQSGRVAAHLMDYCIPEGGKIYIFNFISGMGGNSHIFSREKGFLDYFNEKYRAGEKTLHTVNVNAENPQELEDLLLSHLGMSSSTPKETTGIFVTNSRVFRVADILENEKYTNIRLMGYDLLDANVRHLRNETINFLIGQKPQEQGYHSIMALFNTLVRKREVPKNLFLPIDIITKENIDFYLNL